MDFKIIKIRFRSATFYSLALWTSLELVEQPLQARGHDQENSNSALLRCRAVLMYNLLRDERIPTHLWMVALICISLTMALTTCVSASVHTLNLYGHATERLREMDKKEKGNPINEKRIFSTKE